MDYIVFFAFLAAVVLFGCGFYRKSGTGASAFTMAEGNVPTWVVGMSIFATFVSSISFLGLPGGSSPPARVRGWTRPPERILTLGYE